MSEWWRTKASEIYAAGEAERGNFTPHGVPARIYNWWLHHSPSKKARNILNGYRRENFCHFWRVVVIWAGLLWLGLKVADNVKKVLTVLMTALVVLVVVVLTVTDSWLGLLYALGILLVVAALAVSLVGLGALAARYWNNDWNHIANKIILGFLITVTVGVSALVLIIGTINFGWIFPTMVAVAAGVVSLTVFGLDRWTTYLRGKRILARKVQQERIHNMNDEEYYVWRAEQNRPGKWAVRVDAFLSAVGDFLILATQIVRVKKWKICPLVEVDIDA